MEERWETELFKSTKQKVQWKEGCEELKERKIIQDGRAKRQKDGDKSRQDGA